MKSRLAAIGCRTHSGWAALVVLSGTAKDPEVIVRRRIEICDPGIPGSKQPYHYAEPLSFPDAEKHLKRCADSTRSLSRAALKDISGYLQTRGYRPHGFGITLSSGRPLPELKSILASHALIHTAEGEFYRQALIAAGEHCGLPLTAIRERELFEQASRRLGQPLDRIERRVVELGKSIGPPWTQDQKYAALVAWLAIPVNGNRG